MSSTLRTSLVYRSYSSRVETGTTSLSPRKLASARAMLQLLSANPDINNFDLRLRFERDETGVTAIVDLLYEVPGEPILEELG